MRYLVLLALVGCGGERSGVGTDGTASDSPVGCGTTLSFSPMPAHAGETIRGVASAYGAIGVPAYTWHVHFNSTPVPTTPAQPDGSQVDFVATNAGSYAILVDVAADNFCNPGATDLNVEAPGANSVDYRLHVVPPPSLAPPQDTIIEVDGGANFAWPIALQPGISPSLMLTDGTAGVSAYVRFISSTSPTAYVEAYTGSTGQVNARVLGQPYQVLIVPATSALAPVALSWQPGMGTLTIPAGTLASGKVTAPSGAALAGATVQLSSAGVPSTIAITASDGTFMVRHAFTPGAIVEVAVAPPAASGLPTLSTSAAFDLTQSMQIAYGAGLQTCNLINIAVQRGGVNQPGAQVTAVGSVALAGTVTAGTATTASGVVRVTAIADGTGKLPSKLAPRLSLSAVVQLSSTDLSVAAFDLSACASGPISAPAGPVANGSIVNTAAAALPGARFEAVPTRALALAGAPAVQAIADGNGHISAQLAFGGYYDLRYDDPLGRSAQLVLPDTAAAGVPGTATLGKALRMSGTVSVIGSANPVEGAAIQILCSTCTGLGAVVPVAQTASDSASMYQVAVPDPGTM
jgi:hypothetical protein